MPRIPKYREFVCVVVWYGGSLASTYLYVRRRVASIKRYAKDTPGHQQQSNSRKNGQYMYAAECSHASSRQGVWW